MLTDFAALGAELARVTNQRRVGRVTAVGTAALEIAGLSNHARIGDQVAIGLGRRRGARRRDRRGLRGGRAGDDLCAARRRGGRRRGDAARPGRRAPGGELGRPHRRCLRPAARRPAAGAGRGQRDAAPRAAAAGDAQGIGMRLATGLAVFDTVLPIARGQRIGVFAGSGIGKSSLLADLARGIEAEIVVYALIGERGRELRDFVDNVLGPKGMERAVVDRRHLRPGAADQAPRRLDGDGDGRGLPRPGPARAPLDQFADPLRRGAPRNRADRRRGAVACAASRPRRRT